MGDEVRSREAFGTRPRHWRQVGGGLRTAERVAPLLDPGHPLDPPAAAASLWGALPPTRSVFAGVFRLPPGHSVCLAASRVVLTRHWALPVPASEEPAAAPRALLDGLRAALDRTGPAPVALSGGLDSALLLALAAERGRPLAVVREGDLDGEEAEGALRLARRLGAEVARVHVAEAELPGALAETVRAVGEPVWNGLAAAWTPFHRRVRAAGLDTLVSGLGADEVLCGDPGAARRAWRRLARERLLALDLLEPDLAAAADEAAAEDVPRPPEEGGDPRPWLLERLLPESTLPPPCRTAAACGLDLRLPFLDGGFATPALALPLASLLGGGSGKRVLREAARGLVPEELRLAPKVPRLAPVWGGSEEARRGWRKLCEELLAPRLLATLGLVRAERVRALAERAEALAGEEAAAAGAVLLRLASLVVLRSLA